MLQKELEFLNREDGATVSEDVKYPLWLRTAIWMSDHILLTLLGFSIILVLSYEYFLREPILKWINYLIN